MKLAAKPAPVLSDSNGLSRVPSDFYVDEAAVPVIQSQPVKSSGSPAANEEVALAHCNLATSGVLLQSMLLVLLCSIISFSYFSLLVYILEEVADFQKTQPVQSILSPAKKSGHSVSWHNPSPLFDTIRGNISIIPFLLRGLSISIEFCVNRKFI